MNTRYYKSLIFLLISSLILLAYVNELTANESTNQTIRINNDTPKLKYVEVTYIPKEKPKESKDQNDDKNDPDKNNNQSYIYIPKSNVTPDKLKFNSPSDNNYKGYDNDKVVIFKKEERGISYISYKSFE